MKLQELQKWWVRHWRQDVMGVSPPPEYTTWGQLADKIAWSAVKTTEDRQRMRDRLVAEFDDETKLLFETFKKLIGTLTPAGIVFAVVGGRLLSQQSFVGSMLIVSACVSIIFVTWGLSTRFKVMRGASDSSPSALAVTDGLGGQGDPIKDQLAADVWYYYVWKWHRYCTRLAIDRLFLLACIMLSCTMAAVGLSALL